MKNLISILQSAIRTGTITTEAIAEVLTEQGTRVAKSLGELKREAVETMKGAEFRSAIQELEDAGEKADKGAKLAGEAFRKELGLKKKKNRRHNFENPKYYEVGNVDATTGYCSVCEEVHTLLTKSDADGNRTVGIDELTESGQEQVRKVEAEIQKKRS